MIFRKTIFWMHLISGLTVGIIVAIMSATGIAIAFEHEMLAWIDRDVRTVLVPANTQPLSIEKLDALVIEQRADFKTTARVIPNAADQAYEFRAGRDNTLYVNPYTGAIAEPKSKSVHDKLHVLTEWHRWLGMEGPGRNTGKLITGIANLAFLFLCVTGLYMWWPRSWKPKALKPAFLFVTGIKGRARDFNWHNVFGSWSVIILIVIVTSGAVISFPWASRLVYTLAGEEPPPRGAPPSGPRVQVPTPEAGQEKLALNQVVAQVAEKYPNWKSISFDAAPPSKDNSIQPLSVAVSEPTLFPARGRTQLNIDPYRGTTLSESSFKDRTPGARARTWLRFLHTGEALGVMGKVIATLASAASLFLVYTGFALSYRRFFVRKANVAP